MQINKQILFYMAADFTPTEICKPYPLVLYLWDDCVDVCLHQTGSLRAGKWRRQHTFWCCNEIGLNWLTLQPWSTWMRGSHTDSASIDKALPKESGTPCSSVGSQSQSLLFPPWSWNRHLCGHIKNCCKEPVVELNIEINNSDLISVISLSQSSQHRGNHARASTTEAAAQWQAAGMEREQNWCV